MDRYRYIYINICKYTDVVPMNQRVSSKLEVIHDTESNQFLHKSDERNIDVVKKAMRLIKLVKLVNSH